jgi:hypothetical protein
MGDVLMRLNALYALSALRAAPVTVVVNEALADLARTLYSPRLKVGTQVPSGMRPLTFTHLGLRRLVPAVLRGHRFVNPFVWELAAQTGRSGLKSRMNAVAFRALERMGRVHLPAAQYAGSYLGWTQVSALPVAAGIVETEIRAQLVRDLPELRARLQRLVPPETSARVTTVFPSGTSFQFMPASVAAELAGGAVRFAMHAADPYQEQLRAHGLRIVCFRDARELLQLAASSDFNISTDSFPSHLLQLYTSRSALLLSQAPRARIVHPGFDGFVVESPAPCCPCIHTTRSLKGLCAVGRASCLVWEDTNYLQALGKLARAPKAAGRAALP